MIRRWQVHPDRERALVTGEIVEYVSREAMVDALLDGAAMIDRAGGVLTLLVRRTPTELDGEMLTTHVVLEWKDRTNAKPNAEQAAPAPAAPVVAEWEPDPLYGPEDGVYAAADEEAAAARAAGVTPVATPVGDLLDGAMLPEEDLSEIPAGLR